MPGRWSGYAQLKRGPKIDAHPLSRKGRNLAEKWRRKGYAVRFSR